MDRTEEDMKFVGFFGIFKQSFKTLFNHKKLFTQITLTLILPLAIIFLAHINISRHFFFRIENNYISYSDTYYYKRITVSDWLYYWLFKIIYFTVLTVFSLLSTAAVVFTIASVYTDRDVTYRHVIKIVPKIWKRLFVTFICIYVAMFLYNVIAGIVMVITRSIFGYQVTAAVILLILLIVYLLGFLYLTIIWQLASVVTVLENINGFKAMKKGKTLAYGKKKVGMGIAFVLYVILLGLMFVYEIFVEYGDTTAELKMIWRVMIGILCAIFVMILFLMFIVTQTMLYLVCKSYHREAIDKLSLATYLASYSDETVVVPKPEEIQLGRAQVEQTTLNHDTVMDTSSAPHQLSLSSFLTTSSHNTLRTHHCQP
ncbi:uncharacterized protein [Rutidosis leptorrhynchoides]|uniref:uncharacterized protein n=1 Tax=Rutidosis leptorrhynchoides TaxID=125765 RepID=UPI003A99D439